MNLKIKIISCLLSALSPIMMTAATTDSHYTPSPEVISSQKEFETDRFGIFIHWGIYSMFARGEWYLNYGPKADEYAKAAKGFLSCRLRCVSMGFGHQRFRGTLYMFHNPSPRRLFNVSHCRIGL